MKVRALRRYWRECVLVVTPLLALLGVMSFDPIAQDPRYHDFADTRTILGVPNFVNVLSNIPFLFVGIAGLALCLPRKTGASAAWATFFAGVSLVSIGSSYYHLAPTSATLVWDRLPMTLAFMALVVALLQEHINDALGRYLLAPALAIGFASVAWWHYTDDLRFYVAVQLAPLLAVPCVLGLFPRRYTRRVYLLYALGFYLLAKTAEFYDREFFAQSSNVISGHSLKHLLAAVSVLCVYLMLRYRRPQNT